MKLTANQWSLLEEICSGGKDNAITVSGQRWKTASHLVGKGLARWSEPDARVAVLSTWEGRAAAREKQAERKAYEVRELQRLAARLEVTVWNPPPRAREWLRMVIDCAIATQEERKERDLSVGCRDWERSDFVRSGVLSLILAVANVVRMREGEPPITDAEGAELYERLYAISYGRAVGGILPPLPLVEDRTPEQLAADGDAGGNAEQDPELH